MTHRRTTADTVVWLDSRKKQHIVAIGPACRNAGIESARPIRKGGAYPQRRNYEGFYWCVGSRSHVWYESMLEYTSMMRVDHLLAPQRMASQPMLICFADGTSRTPDFLALLPDGRGILYDVKLSDKMNEDNLAKFAKTEAVCARIGWDYEVLNEIPRIER